MAARGGGRVVGVVFRLALPGLLGLAAPCPAHAAAPAGQWWNAGYRYRQQLSLTSGTTPIPTQYSVRLQLDHAALVSVSKSLGHARGIPVGELRLERQGQPAAFHVEPATGSFGPGSRLLFFAEAAADSLAFSPETAWELLHAREGLRMPVASAAPPSTAVRTAPSRRARFELNRFYQPGLLKASDLWLWEAVPAGAARTLTLSLSGVDPGASFVAALDVDLQGASESGQAVDHHVRVSLAGVPLGEAQFAGKRPYRMSLNLPATLQREGANELTLANLGDTGVASYVFLDRVALTCPQAPSLHGGVFEGSWSETGAATLVGGTTRSHLLDVTAANAATGPPRWLAGHEAALGSLRFSVEAGRRHFAIADEALLRPRVVQATAPSLRLTLNCLNGYFVAPTFDSLSESLVKAEGRGAIAAVSPAGLSLDGPAHQYHRARMAELTSGRHGRLGDAILAAQRTYTQSGLMPELLAIYQLLGDPAMPVR